MKFGKKIIAYVCLVSIVSSLFSGIHVAHAGFLDGIVDTVSNWMGGNKGFLEIKGRDYSIEWPWGGGFSSTVPRTTTPSVPTVLRIRTATSPTTIAAAIRPT
jgi:hypothetical protein